MYSATVVPYPEDPPSPRGAAQRTQERKDAKTNQGILSSHEKAIAQKIQQATRRRLPKRSIRICFEGLLGLLISCVVLSYSIFRINLGEQNFQELQRKEMKDITGKLLNEIEKQLLTSVSSTKALAAIVQLDAAQNLLSPLNAQVEELVDASAAVAASSKDQLSAALKRKEKAKSEIIYNSTKYRFNHVARSLIDTYKGITNLQLAPAGVVSAIYPLRGNEGAIGHDLFFDPKRRDGALRAISSQEITFVGPVRLIQSGRSAIIARFPIFMESDFSNFRGKVTDHPFWFGFATMLCLIDDLFEATSLDSSQDFDVSYVLYAQTLTGDDVFVRASHDVEGQPLTPTDDVDKIWLQYALSKDPVRRELKVLDLNVHWHLLTWPKQGWKPHSGMYILQIALCVFFFATSLCSVHTFLVRQSVMMEVGMMCRELEATPKFDQLG